jgi:hypothetical protein
LAQSLRLLGTWVLWTVGRGANVFTAHKSRMDLAQSVSCFAVKRVLEQLVEQLFQLSRRAVNPGSFLDVCVP